MKYIVVVSALSLIFFTGCGGEDSGKQSQNSSSGNSGNGLTEFQLTNGIGPVKESIEINSIDPDMAKKGAQIFKTKCSACHKMDERYVGPPLGNVLEARTPAFVMNMILNPDQMVKEHPVAKQMLAEYMTPMPNQNIEAEEARAIVEYLASEKQ